MQLISNLHTTLESIRLETGTAIFVDGYVFGSGRCSRSGEGKNLRLGGRAS